MTIDIDGGVTVNVRIRRFRQAAVAAVLAVVALGAVLFAALGYSWVNASDAVAASEQMVTDLRKQLAARGGGDLAGDRDLAAILARRRAQRTRDPVERP